jgi:hypothetical protein
MSEMAKLLNDGQPLTEKERYVAECRAIVDQHFKESKLRVIYVKRKLPKIAFPIDKIPDFDKLSKLFRQHSSLDYRTFSALVGRSEDFFSLPMFLTIQRLERFRSTPHLGVVALFEKDNTAYVGWSLCNQSLGDNFNKYIGIRKAINRAMPTVAAHQIVYRMRSLFKIRKNASLTEKELAERVLRLDGMIAHTCLPFVEKALKMKGKQNA